MKQSQLIRIYIDYKDSSRQQRFLSYIPMYLFAIVSIRLYRDSK